MSAATELAGARVIGDTLMTQATEELAALKHFMQSTDQQFLTLLIPACLAWKYKYNRVRGGCVVGSGVATARVAQITVGGETMHVHVGPNRDYADALKVEYLTFRDRIGGFAGVVAGITNDLAAELQNNSGRDAALSSLAEIAQGRVGSEA